MEKEIKIKVKVDLEFKLNEEVNCNDWDEASAEQRQDYVRQKVYEYISDNIDDIVEELHAKGQIDFNFGL